MATKSLQRDSFKTKNELYVAEYPKNPKTIRISEMDVPLPKMPAKSEMVNYGLPEKDQKFKRDWIPDDLQMWDKRREELFVEALFHKRQHGQWYLIKGTPVYLTGDAYFYYNFWETEQGGYPDFRMEGVRFFLFSEMCHRDPDCYGMMIIKPRRIGDTDKALAAGYNRALLYRKSWFGMQNINEDDAKDNYLRVVDAHERMPYFFKPVQKGRSNSTKELRFEKPGEVLTQDKLRKKKKEKKLISAQEKDNSLKSKVDYAAAKEKAYDGKRLSYYHLDEPGKMTEMDPYKAWNIVKRTLSLYNEQLIIGYCVMTTTVEELKDAETVKTMVKLWKASDPTDRDANNRTKTGLYRYFRDALENTPVDAWGFHQKEEGRKFLENTIAKLEEDGDYEELTQLKRKHPMRIEDALMVPATDCALLPHILDKRKAQLFAGVDKYGKPQKKRAVRGTLIWKDGFGSSVEWAPDPNGAWEITQMPDKPNAVRVKAGKMTPTMDPYYSMGCDPVDAKSNDGQGSDGSFAVYRKFDPLVDVNVIYSDQIGPDGSQEITNPEVMVTDQFVCNYLHRPADPHDFFEDCLKTCIFYGVSMFMERDKPYVANRFEETGYGKFLLLRPRATYTNYRKQGANNETGSKATVPIINLYVDLLKFHIKNRIDTYHSERQIDDYRQFNVANRTLRDLSVASGFALIAANDRRHRQGVAQQKKKWDNIWDTFKKQPAA